jgi:hypothetical protein
MRSCGKRKPGLLVANGSIFAVDSTQLSLRAVANEAVRANALRCRIERNLRSCAQV